MDALTVIDRIVIKLFLMKKDKKEGAEKAPIPFVTCEECINMVNVSELNVGFCNSSRMPRPVKTKKQCMYYKII